MNAVDRHFAREFAAWMHASAPTPLVTPEAKAAVLDLVDFLERHPQIAREVEADLQLRDVRRGES